MIPTGNTDFTGTMGGTPPQNLTNSGEGTVAAYLWLVDNSGNEAYNNYATVALRYDATFASPTNFAEHMGSSDNVWQNNILTPSFDWSAPADISGIEKYMIYFGPDEAGAIPTDSTGIASYSTNAPEGTSYFRVQPRDSAGDGGTPSTSLPDPGWPPE